MVISQRQKKHRYNCILNNAFGIPFKKGGIMKTYNIILIAAICCVLAALVVYAYIKNKVPKSSFKTLNVPIMDQARTNDFFRKEIITGPHSQIVLMSVPVGGEIGEETHDVDQILIFAEGDGIAILNGARSEIHKDHAVFIPAGTRHNFRNTGTIPLKLFTIYAPIEHEPGTIERVKSN